MDDLRMVAQLRFFAQVQYEFDNDIELNEPDQAIRAVEDILLDTTPFIILNDVNFVQFDAKNGEHRSAKVQLLASLEYCDDLDVSDKRDLVFNKIAEHLFTLDGELKLLVQDEANLVSEPVPSELYI